MKRSPGKSPHIDTQVALDYLENRLTEAQRAPVEVHLASPCPDCRERVREVGRTLELMRLDRTPEVPDAVRARALSVFQDRPRESPVRRAAARVAELLFDSWAQPAPALARRAVGEARRLRYTLGGQGFELEIELESQGMVTLRGRLDAPEPALCSIVVEVGEERRAAWPDAGGAFAIEHVPTGQARVSVTGLERAFHLPPVEL
ncbi:MAG: hypothetical protein HZB25_07245 [Candidatus Eisenbacteria bacterium]|nr:hypothetical protein [Candidatus Eisenbacteria bacterium]